MAGIGFELKKLFNKKGYLPNIAAYFYSAMVTVGPMIICMSVIVFSNIYLTDIGVIKNSIELLIAIIVYAFVFSIIITGGFVYILSRYISDNIFEGKFGKILPSFYGSQIVVLLISGVVGFLFLAFSPLDTGYKILSYLLFVEISILWIEMVYISALRNYSKILKGFFTGALILIALTLIFTKFTGLDPVKSSLLSIDIGFFYIVLSFAIYIKQFYFHFEPGIFKFLSYFRKYSTLFLIGFFITFGAYIHIIIFWFSKSSLLAGNYFRYCPLYDMPMFYSILTVIPAMVLFVVSVETHFYGKYKAYYSLIINGGTIREIKLAKSEMIEVLLQQITYIMELQLFISFLSITIGVRMLPFIGFTRAWTDTFSILVLGSFLYIIMIIIVLILLYFDDKNGALTVALVFFTSNAAFTLFFLQMGDNFIGAGYFVGSFITLSVALLRLRYFLKNIDYYTYCKQPLYSIAKPVDFRHRGGAASRIAEVKKMGTLDGKNAGTEK